jgi:hypothetical protein
MRKAIWIVGAIAAATAAALACSSSSNGGGNGSSCFSTSLNTSGNTNCSSCVESKCGSQLSGVESGCSDFINCVCTGGTYNANNVQTCLSKEQESSCTSAITPLSSCENQNCASQCGVTSSGGGSGSGSGSSSGSGSGSSSGSSSGTSSGGTPTGTCATLETCCQALPSSAQSGCTTIADLNNQSTCQAELSGLTDAGLCP